ncbi:P-loop containing nucleoside triphosphate hydrolase [Arabidopsis thaliana x Arabidopsis arenosa]|uniref:P-loop containing nucleoside triphosphate hydrolase n=1 Tax=Arabidopsis thaliana x Arabidopsis arenosa TaxID=1240361 RepID=A0A8T2AXE9_9BRAS|nr:P-loop containing nucleoside triphosphate hydrolase [Arabidopsis thaliana x Arabidopsis arenosa]
MGDGTEVVVRSDRISDEQVAKNELLGSDEVKEDKEDDVFEEAIGSENDEQEEDPNRELLETDDLPLEETRQSSKDENEVEDFEEAVGDLDETSSNEGGVKDLNVDYSVVGESHGAGEAGFDVVAPKMNGDKGEGGAGDSCGKVESSLDVVENTEMSNTNGLKLAAEDVSIENGQTHSFLGNGIASPKNKEVVAEVIPKDDGIEEPWDDGIEVENWEERVDGVQTEQEVEEGEGRSKNLFEKQTEQEVVDGARTIKNLFENGSGSVCIDNESEAKTNGETGAAYTSNIDTNASGDKSVNDSIEVASAETSSPLDKSSSGEKGETEGDSTCLKQEQQLASSPTQLVVDGAGTGKNLFENGSGSVCIDNESEAKTNGETGAAYTSDIETNASGDKSVNDSTEVASAESSSPLDKSSSGEKGETEGDSSCLKPEQQLASSPNSNPESTEIRSNSGSPGVTSRENETVRNSNGGHDVQQRPQPNKELEKQQSSRVNVDPEIKENSHVETEAEVVSSVSPTESRSNPAALPPARPAGLGRASPLLEPASRAPQQSRVNGNGSHNQSQQAEDSTTVETDEHDETREKLQLIRVKFLRLAHRLGQTPHNVVVAQVLYRLGLAEQLRGRNGSRVGAFSFDRASAMAEQLEAAGQDPLDFSCTIMVLGKSGVGKSATINSIFDEVKFCTDAFQMGTKRVQDVEGLVQGIKVRVIDTPGLLPSWSDQAKNEKILNSVKAFIKKNPPDIVLYLDRLDMQSRDSGDMPLLRTISDVFGPSIWFNAIVGLTHAASVPPDGPNGTASSYDMFVTQRSHVIQQAIRQAAGDMRLMNPVSLVENHSACRTNRAGQRVLPNGQVWKPHLLLLSFASKILAEANALLKLQDNIPGRPFAARSKAPPLPFLLSSLLQSRPQPKLPEQQYGDEEDEDDLDESSDSDEESEYDQLPPFKSLTKAQMATLSKSQKKQYLDEMEYREKLLMKKQMKEEKKRRKMFKKFAAEIKDLPDGFSENVEDESGGPASVPVPMPDLSLPASFDSDNPTHRYRYLDSSNQWLVRPVLETHGWDHDIGYEGVNAERLFVVKDKIPISVSGQVTKDKKDANVQLEMASSVKHGEGKSTSLGFDMQTVGKELAYTLRSETRFNNFRRNKAAAGLSVTLLGDSVSAGMKVEDKLIASKWFRMVMSGGAMTSRGDFAYGGTLEAQLRDKDYPLGRFLTTLGLSVMDWHGDLAIGGNIQSQVPIGRSSNLIARCNLNNRGAGQVSVRVNSSEQIQLAMVAIVPLFKKLLSYCYPPTQYGQ